MGRTFPPENRGMTVLRREKFDLNLPLVVAELNDFRMIEQVYKSAIKNDLLNLARVSGIVNSDGGKKGILLATHITHPETAPSQLDSVTRTLFEQAGVNYKPYELKLGYEYWTVKDILRSVLPGELGHTSRWFRRIGSIAVLRLEERFLPYKKLIGEVLLDKSKPRVLTAVCNLEAICPNQRLFDMEVIAGVPDFTTDLFDLGCLTRLDVRNFFLNGIILEEEGPHLEFDLSDRQPRCDFNQDHDNKGNLFYDYSRGQAVCDVFSGEGITAVCAAKDGNIVFANEPNERSYNFLKTNASSNGFNGINMHLSNISPRDFIRNSISSLHALRDSWENQTIVSHRRKSSHKRTLRNGDEPLLLGIPSVFSHYLLMSPDTSIESLDAFRGIYKNKRFIVEPELPQIHFAMYCHDKEDSFSAVGARVSQALGYNTRIRSIGHRHDVLGKNLLFVDFELPREVAYM